MKHWFYELVRMITEMITGIDSSAMSLAEFVEWVFTKDEIIFWCNIGVVVAINVIAFSIFGIIMFAKIIIEENKVDRSKGRVPG